MIILDATIKNNGIVTNLNVLMIILNITIRNDKFKWLSSQPPIVIILNIPVINNLSIIPSISV